MSPFFIIYIALSVIMPVVSLYFWRAHRNDAKSYRRRGDKLLLPLPSVFFWIMLAANVFFAVIGVSDYDNLFGIIQVLQIFAFWMTMSASRLFLCYNADGVICRSAFGRVKEYSYSDIHFYSHILGDALVCVGSRVILIDFTQGWFDFEDSYRRWQQTNGAVKKKNKQATGLRKTLSINRLGLSAFIIMELFFFGCGALFVILGVIQFVSAEISFSAFVITFFGIASCVLGVLNVVCLSDPIKHRKLFNKLWKNSIFDEYSKRNRW